MMAPKITIGLPVYNGEKTICKTLDSISKQTFSDFKLIISDNNSIDDTMKICKEYNEKNSNVIYYRQKENMGGLENFKFVLNHVDSEYFVWLAADDWWEPTFLEKNLAILESNKEYVASISKIDYYDVEQNIDFSKNKNRLKIKKFYSYKDYSKFKSLSERIFFYLRLNRAENIYAIFRTSILKKCINNCFRKPSVAMDLKILLFIQRYGEINLLNEILMHRSGKGSSSQYSNKNRLTEENDFGILGKIFPFLSFSIWIIRNLGFKKFFINFDYLLFQNISGTKHQIKQFIKK